MYTVYVQQKRLLIVSVAALFVVLSGGVILLLRLSSKTAPSSPPAELSSGSAASQPSKTLKKYNDASGFSFQYPEDVSIAEVSADNTTYSSLALRSQEARGGLTITIKDSPYASLDAWEKENKKLISGKGIPGRLGDIAVKEYQTDGNLIAVGIDKNILFLVNADFQENESYWGSAYNSLLSSFSFSLPQSDQSSGDDASFGDEGAIEDEGEEVIE